MSGQGVLSAAGDWLAIGLLHGTALAALTGLAALTPLGRARPALWSALWTIVLLKFLVPVGPASELSLSSAIERLVARPAGGGAALDAAAAAPAPHQAAAPAGPDLLALALAAVYLAGFAWLLARRIAARRRLGRHLAGLPGAGEAVRDAVAAAARRVGLGRPVPARIDPAAAGPYLAGRLRPVLVLPAWLAPDDPAFAAAVAHELAHLRRRDPLLAAVQGVASLLFWFWPPVAWVCRRLDRAREMACDEWALAAGSISRRAYARFLVEVAGRRARGGAAPAAGAIALLRRSQLAARIDHLLDRPRPARLGRLRAAVAAWAALCLAGASSAAQSSGGGFACSLDPEVIAQILSSHPSADTDGDGSLSAEEACAHQRRMKRRLLDHVVDAELVSRLDPDADLDGDGVLSAYEIDYAKSQIDVELADGAGDEVVLEYAGLAAVPLPADEIRVAAASATGRLCRSASRCSAGEAPGRFPLLIDVAPAETAAR